MYKKSSGKSSENVERRFNFDNDKITHKTQKIKTTTDRNEVINDEKQQIDSVKS